MTLTPDVDVDRSVTVVVPVYNGEATIEACLLSIVGLDFPKEWLEVIIVDNASTDGTAAVLERYRTRIRLVYETTRGPAAARNAGVRAARGEWIAFTDADCIVDPHWLRYLLPPLHDVTVGIAGGEILSVRPCNRIELFGERIHDHRRAMEEFVPPYAITMNWATRRAVLLEAGLFDEDLLRGEDGDLAYRLQARGYRLAYCPRARVFHHNESTLSGLFREGMAHGMASTMIWAKSTHAVLRRPRQRFPTGRRILWNARRCLAGESGGAAGNRFDAFCAVVFDLGKVVGASRTQRRLRRSRRDGAGASSLGSSRPGLTT